MEEEEDRDRYRDQIVTCDVGVSLHSKTHPPFMKYSNGTSAQFYICIPVSELVSCAFSTIPICPFSFIIHVYTRTIVFWFVLDPSLNPHNVIPVFQALTGHWEVIGDYPNSLAVVPDARAQLFRERFSVPDQRTEAGRYYALYDPDPSWKELSLNLYRAGETEALQLARPHIQAVTGTVLSCFHVYIYHLNVLCIALHRGNSAFM